VFGIAGNKLSLIDSFPGSPGLSVPGDFPLRQFCFLLLLNPIPLVFLCALCSVVQFLLFLNPADFSSLWFPSAPFAVKMLLLFLLPQARSFFPLRSLRPLR
jgi:hypothetical protein